MSNYCTKFGILCGSANAFGYCSITACTKYTALTETAKWNNTHSPNVIYNITTIKTNADRIRTMTDDELADFFFESPEIEFEVCVYCKNFGGHMSDTPCKCDYGRCYIPDKNEAFKKWLKQPVTSIK